MNNACWIEAPEYENADKKLREAFDSVRGPDGGLGNLYLAYGLRPHTLQPADALYRAVLHHPDNTIPTWFTELISTYVAMLCECEYAFTHHGHNFRYLLNDEDRARKILRGLSENRSAGELSAREACALTYVRKLTLNPGQITRDDVTALREQGWSDGEILEIVQVASSFGYWARVINGLGISLQGEKIGFYQDS